MISNEFLNASFLGAYGENNELFEQMLTEFVRDHVFWRRNFHPLDRPPISTAAAYEPSYIQSVAKMKDELHQLTARLKASVPTYNPRYIGHMFSDLLLPGLLAQMVTTLYNPNNISEDTAPATVEMELAVGRQLATMFGFATTKGQVPCAFGHITSGGTVANYEGVWLMQAVRYLPLALKQACIESGHELQGPNGQPLSAVDSQILVNLPPDTILNLYDSIADLPEEQRFEFYQQVGKNRYEQLGARHFFAKHSDIDDGIVIVPKSAHYSWAKAMRFLGLGEDNLWQAGVDASMRLDIDELALLLEKARKERRPVIAVVAVMGTTEFGTIDPVDGIVDLREKCEALGQSFGIHVDAAWGGYLASMFRGEQGQLLDRQTVNQDCKYFPTDPTYNAFAALSEVDSITVDPHKLGFVPFGTGAFVVRDNRISRLVVQKAAYIFESGDPDDFRQLGQFIVEGSKPGAAAAAAYVTHNVLPLNGDHFGRLCKLTIRNTELFYDKVRALAEKLKDKVELIIPIMPDTNLLCIAFNPLDNHDIKVMNEFNHQFYQHIRPDLNQAVQDNEFFGSSTLLYSEKLTLKALKKMSETLTIDFHQLAHEAVESQDNQAKGIFLIRHTLMNPWLSDNKNGDTYLDMYCAFIERTLDELLSSE